MCMTALAVEPITQPPLDTTDSPTNSAGGSAAGLLLVGFSYRSAPLSILERLTLTSDDLPGLLSTLMSADSITEAMVVSTCNRVEVYVVMEQPAEVAPAVLTLLAGRSGLALPELVDSSYVLRDDAAARHLFEVAAGLDSLVVGDSQVLGQVRSAYAVSTASRTAGPVLHPLVQQALRAGKEVASNTHLSQLGVATITAALQHAAEAMPEGRIRGQRALVLGAGAMGALAVTHFQRLGASEVVVVNRTLSRARLLAAATGSTPVRAVAADRLSDALAKTDAVLACAASPTAIISAAQAETAVARRGTSAAALVILDLGLPRNVDPAAAAVTGIMLTDLNGLRQGTQGGQADEQELSAVHAIVTAHFTNYRVRRTTTAATTTVAALHRGAATIARAEEARLRARLPGLDRAAQQELSQALHRLTAELLRVTSEALKPVEVSDQGHHVAHHRTETTITNPTPNRSTATSSEQPRADFDMASKSPAKSSQPHRIHATHLFDRQPRTNHDYTRHPLHHPRPPGSYLCRSRVARRQLLGQRSAAHDLRDSRCRAHLPTRDHLHHQLGMGSRQPPDRHRPQHPPSRPTLWGRVCSCCRRRMHRHRNQPRSPLVLDPRTVRAAALRALSN